LRSDWEEVKDEVMRRAVLRKFETHIDIRAILLATGDEPIIENTPATTIGAAAQMAAARISWDRS
jgi:hypothetical protein